MRRSARPGQAHARGSRCCRSTARAHRQRPRRRRAASGGRRRCSCCARGPPSRRPRSSRRVRRDRCRSCASESAGPARAHRPCEHDARCAGESRLRDHEHDAAASRTDRRRVAALQKLEPPAGEGEELEQERLTLAGGEGIRRHDTEGRIPSSRRPERRLSVRRRVEPSRRPLCFRPDEIADDGAQEGRLPRVS